MAAEREICFGRVGAVEDRRSTGDELGEKPRKELVKNPRAAEEQSVGVAALRNPAPVDRIVRQHVAFDDRYGSVEVGQHPRGEQPAHTGAEYHGMVTKFG